MMLSNGKPSEVKLPLAEAAEVMFDAAGRIAKKSEKTEFFYQGRKIRSYGNYDVKGSESRDTSRMQLVFRDHVGRLTLEPVGKEAVGVLMRGGTNGRMSIVGFFEEVKRAAAD